MPEPNDKRLRMLNTPVDERVRHQILRSPPRHLTTAQIRILLSFNLTMLSLLNFLYFKIFNKIYGSKFKLELHKLYWCCSAEQ